MDSIGSRSQISSVFLGVMDGHHQLLCGINELANRRFKVDLLDTMPEQLIDPTQNVVTDQVTTTASVPSFDLLGTLRRKKEKMT